MSLSTDRSPAIFDRDHLDAQTFGDVDLAHEVLGLFRMQAARLAPMIANGAATDPASTARVDAAHTLKGSARGIGAFRVAGCAEACEAALREGRDALGALADLATALAETDVALGVWMADHSRAHPPGLTEAPPLRTS